MSSEEADNILPGDGSIEDQLRAFDEAQEELAAANEELRVQQDELLSHQEQLRQQNAALEAERQRYQALFELAPDGYLVTDLQGLIREANEAACALLGVPARQALGTLLSLYLPGTVHDALSAHLRGLREGRAAEVRNWETSLAPREGAAVDVLISITPARSPEGEVTGLRWLVRDITQRVQWEQERERLLAEQMQAEKALRVSMEKYKVLFESFPLGITVSDQEGQIVEANAESERLLGISREEHRRRQVDGGEWQIVRLDGSPMPPEEYASVRALREGRLVEDVEMGIARREGETTWISVTAAPVPVEGYGVAVAYGDITARVRAEQRLRQYAERLRLQHEVDRAILSSRSAEEMVEAVLRQLPQLLPCQRAGVNLLDPEAQEVWLLATYSAGETSLAKGWHAPVAESLGEAMAQLARGERFVVDDMQALAPWSPLAEQLQAERVRAEVLQPLIVQGELIGALGIGMTVPGPLPAEQIEAVGQLADALAVGIQQMRLYEQVRRHAGRLEERVQARTAELAASEARFRAVYEQAGIGIALLDEGGRVLASNPALQRILGYGAHELEGFPLSAFAHRPHPASHPGAHLRPPGPGQRGASPQRPAPLVDTDEGPPERRAPAACGRQGAARHGRAGVPGSPFAGPAPADDTGEGPRERRALAACDRQGAARHAGEGAPGSPFAGPAPTEIAGETEGGQPTRPYEQVERRYRRRDGGVIQANVTTSPIHLEGEAARLAVALIEDVTERVEAQEALRQSERLALTGRLAASVAHEIGNPLQAVIGCLSLAEEVGAEGGDTRPYMQVAMEELERAARLVGRMRDLNRPSEGEWEAADVNDMVEKVLLLSRKQCQTHGVEVAWEAGEGLPAVSVIVDRLQQVLLNLALNAVDAMPEGGRLAVRTAATAGPAGIEVTFADTGSGIPQEQLERLFEPFSSTKTQGLGLGLYVSRNIVREHKGHIHVQSEPGHGTTFTVWLPAEQ